MHAHHQYLSTHNSVSGVAWGVESYRLVSFGGTGVDRSIDFYAAAGFFVNLVSSLSAIAVAR